MLIYLDLLFILNYWIDFLLLLSTNMIMKYKINYIKTIISSFVGAFSTFLIFIDNEFLLIILKIIICMIMQLIMNGYNGIKTLLENILYFYLSSIILAGTVYLIDGNSLSIKERYILLILITPIVLYLSKKQIKKLNNYYKNIYKVIVNYHGKKYYFNAFLDTGNNLYDQYKKRPISLIYTNKIRFNYEDGILVPYETASGKSLLKCFVADKLIVDNKIINNAVIGLIDKEFKIQDINMILHKDIIGGFK